MDLSRTCCRALFSGVLIAGVIPMSSPVARGDDKTLERVSPAAAPIKMRLTLAEARDLALRNNKALELARLNVSEKGYAAKAARKDYLPKLMGTDSYFHFNQPLGSVVTVQQGKRGLLPPNVSVFDANVLNQDSNLASLF